MSFNFINVKILKLMNEGAIPAELFTDDVLSEMYSRPEALFSINLK